MNCADSKGGQLLCNPHPHPGFFFFFLILGQQGNFAYRLRAGLPAQQLLGGEDPREDEEEEARNKEDRMRDVDEEHVACEGVPAALSVEVGGEFIRQSKVMGETTDILPVLPVRVRQ